MTKRQLILLPLIAAVVIAGSYAFAAVRDDDGDQLSIDQVLLDIADQPAPTDTISFLEARAAENPDSFIDLTNLGNAHVRMARYAGDISAYGRAEEAYRRALEVNPAYYPALTGLAAVHFAQHEFDRALDIVQPLAVDDRNLTAIALVGDIHVALGEYEQAEAEYARIEGTGLGSELLTRRSQLAWLRGDVDTSIRLMREATASADRASDFRENLAWYRYQVGDLAFRSGDLDAAQSAFADALKIQEDAYLALAGLGRVAAARGDLDEAIEMYSRSVAIVPLPDVLAELGDVYAAAGESDLAREQYDTVEFIGELAEVNGAIYNRQLALFYANHDLRLDVAMKLAERELDTRQDVYGYDTYAWVLYKLDRFAEASEAMSMALRLGTRDPVLLYHAGMIQDALGNHDAARDYLQEAVDINPAFDVLQAPLARAALERLG